MDRHVIGKKIVDPRRRNNQLIRISGSDKIKGVATGVCVYSDVLVEPNAVEEFVKSACIRIPVNHVDVELKVLVFIFESSRFSLFSIFWLLILCLHGRMNKYLGFGTK